MLNILLWNVLVFFLVFFSSSKCYSLWLRVFILLSIWRRKWSKKKKIWPAIISFFFCCKYDVTQPSDLSEFFSLCFRFYRPKFYFDLSNCPPPPPPPPVAEKWSTKKTKQPNFDHLAPSNAMPRPVCCVSKETRKKRICHFVELLLFFCKYKENKLLLPIVLLIIFYKSSIWIWRRIKNKFFDPSHGDSQLPWSLNRIWFQFFTKKSLDEN